MRSTSTWQVPGPMPEPRMLARCWLNESNLSSPKSMQSGRLVRTRLRRRAPRSSGQPSRHFLMRIPLAKPDISAADIQAVARVLGTPRLSLGAELKEFEHSVAGYVGAPHAVAVSSGTSALHLCIRALDIGPGDEVIVPSFAFIAVAN